MRLMWKRASLNVEFLNFIVLKKVNLQQKLCNSITRQQIFFYFFYLWGGLQDESWTKKSTERKIRTSSMKQKFSYLISRTIDQTPYCQTAPLLPSVTRQQNVTGEKVQPVPPYDQLLPRMLWANVIKYYSLLLEQPL